MSNKTIEINTEFLNVAGGKKKKKTKKINPENKKKDLIVSTKSLRNKFLEKIKTHQQQNILSNHVSADEDSTKENNTFEQDFDQLNKLVQKKDAMKNEKKKKRKTKKKNLKNQSSINDNINIHWPSDEKITNASITFLSEKPSTIQETKSISNPPIINNIGNSDTKEDFASKINELDLQKKIDEPELQKVNNLDQAYESNEEPRYGNLKGGKKPTYKQFYKTRKTNDFQKPGKKYRKKFKKTKKTTFTLGKKNNKVSVLIKNNETRKRIKKEHALLKQIPLNEIKKQLLEKNLISIGTTAPSEVLRKMYEDSILAGNINNVNKHNSLFNFYNNK